MAVFAASVTMQFCLGLLFAWGSLYPVLMQAHGWDEATALAPYRYSLLCFSAGLLAGWRFLESRGARLTAAIGGLTASFGLLLCALFGGDPLGLTVGYGVVAGFGFGFAFMAPLASVLRVYTHSPRVYGGLTVAGMAVGGLLLPFAIRALVDTNPGHMAASLPDLYSFLAIFLLVGLVAPSRILPAGGRAVAEPAGNLKRPPWASVFRTWLFWVVFFLGAAATLGALIQESPVLQGFRSTPAWSSAGAFVLLMGFGNLGGLDFWNWLREHYGKVRARGVFFSLTSVASLAVSGGDFSFSQFFLVLSLAGFAFGGFLSIMPTLARHMLEFRTLTEGVAVVLAAYGVSTLFRVPAIPQAGPLNWLDAVVLLLVGGVLLGGMLHILNRGTSTAG